MEKGDVIGCGREAEVIYWGNDRVLKLFYKNFPSSIIDFRFKVDTLIGNIFPNCPKAFEKIEENARFGILYEFIEGITLNKTLAQNKKISKSTKILAELHVKMHKYEITAFNNQKNVLVKAINETNLLQNDQKKEIINYLDTLPDGNKICHMDFHFENIIISKNKLYVIDWANACSGNPNCDVARTYYVLKYGLGSTDEQYIKKSFIHRSLLRFAKSLVAKSQIKHYLKLTDKSKKEIKKWDLAIYASRLREGIPLENEKLLKMISKLLKHHK